MLEIASKICIASHTSDRTFRSLSLASWLYSRIPSPESNLLGTIYQVQVFVKSVKQVTTLLSVI